MRIGIFGRGRLATAIAGHGGGAVRWQVGREQAPPDSVDVAIEASVGEVVPARVKWALEQRTPLLIASTGWLAGDWLQTASQQVGILVAPNLSVTMGLFRRMTRVMARYCDLSPARDPYLLEFHHANKRDAPSGTAVELAETLLRDCSRKTSWTAAPLNRALRPEELCVASVRSGQTASSHEVGFQAPGEVFELRHEARDLSPYGEGAILGANWLSGRTGLYSFDDVVADTINPMFLEI